MLDGRHRMLGEEIGKQPHHGPAIFQHVGHAGRGAQIVLQHIEIVFRHPHQIDAGDLRVHLVGQIDAAHLGPVHGIVQHLMGADHAGLDDFLVVIDVVEESVQRPYPLLEPLLQPAPFVGAKDARHHIERNQALTAIGLAVDGKGDAQPPEQQFGLGALARERALRQAVQPLRVGAVDITDRSIDAVHFVEEGLGCCRIHALNHASCGPTSKPAQTAELAARDIARCTNPDGPTRIDRPLLGILINRCQPQAYADIRP